MKASILISILFACLGCTCSKFQTPTGGVYSNQSFMWKRDAAKVHIMTNGEIVIDMLGSRTDSDALRAVASGAAEGTVTGMGKAVKLK